MAIKQLKERIHTQETRDTRFYWLQAGDHGGMYLSVKQTNWNWKVRPKNKSCLFPVTLP